MKKPYGTTIFCDDIRDELSGKKTYVGTYRGDFVINHAFPVVVPQFCLSISYLEPLHEDLLPTVIKVYVPGDTEESEVVLELELPPNRKELVKDKITDPFAEYFGNTIDFRITPFLIKKEGHVKVRAYQGDNEYRLGTLYLRNPNPNERKLKSS